MVVPKFATLRLFIDNKSVEFKTSDPLSFFKADLNEIWRLFYEKCGYTEEPIKKNRLNPRRRRALRSRTGIPTCIVKDKPVKSKVQVDEQPRVALESSYTAPVQRIFSFFKREVVPCKPPEVPDNVGAKINLRRNSNFADNTIKSIFDNFKKLRKKPDISKGYYSLSRLDTIFEKTFKLEKNFLKLIKQNFSEFGVKIFGDLNFYKDDVDLLVKLMKDHKLN